MTDAQTRTKRGLDFDTAAGLADLLHELSHNKETRKGIAALIKKARPDSTYAAAFADVDVEDKFENFKAEQEAKDIKRQQDQILARMNRQRSGLLTGGEDGSGRKYSEEDVGKIEALMTKKGLSDYEDAAILYASTLPPDNPQPGRDVPAPHGSTWEFPEWSKFGADPVKASRDTANQVITEFMRAKR